MIQLQLTMSRRLSPPIVQISLLLSTATAMLYLSACENPPVPVITINNQPDAPALESKNILDLKVTVEPTDIFDRIGKGHIPKGEIDKKATPRSLPKGDEIPILLTSLPTATSQPPDKPMDGAPTLSPGDQAKLAQERRDKQKFAKDFCTKMEDFNYLLTEDDKHRLSNSLLWFLVEGKRIRSAQGENSGLPPEPPDNLDKVYSREHLKAIVGQEKAERLLVLFDANSGDMYNLRKASDEHDRTAYWTMGGEIFCKTFGLYPDIFPDIINPQP